MRSPRPEIGQDFGGALDGLGALQAADHLRQHDVFERGEFRQQPVRLIDEADIGAADLGSLDVRQARGRGPADIDLAVVGAFEQAGDMQQRRFAGARRRHQRHRLPRPQRELGAVEDGQRRLPLHVLALYLVEIDDRYIFRPLLHLALTRTGALRRDRGARRATTDTAWRGRTASAP